MAGTLEADEPAADDYHRGHRPHRYGAAAYGLESSVPNFIANHGFLPPGRSWPWMTGDHCGILP